MPETQCHACLLSRCPCVRACACVRSLVAVCGSKKAFITLCSPVVPLLSTSKADSGLASEFRWDRAIYTAYERMLKAEATSKAYKSNTIARARREHLSGAHDSRQQGKHTHHHTLQPAFDTSMQVCIAQLISNSAKEWMEMDSAKRCTHLFSVFVPVATWPSVMHACCLAVHMHVFVRACVFVVWWLCAAAKSIHYLVFPGGPPPEY